jgi:hypothetical protein
MLNLTEAEFREKLRGLASEILAMVGPSPEDWVNTKEARILSGLRTNTLRKYHAEGLLTCQFTPGGHRRYSRQQLTELSKMWEEK